MKEVKCMSVTYIVKKTGRVIKKEFDSEFLCRKFVNKIKHSKVCELVSYPVFN